MKEINGSKQESSARSVLSLLRSRPGRGMPALVVLSGPSHAGKSTFACKLRRQFGVISSDEIREELARYFGRDEAEARVWKVFEAMKRQALKEGRNVLLDACHLSRQARWHSLQGPNARHRKICVVFDLALRTLRQRCLRTRRVSLCEVERMWGDFQQNRPAPDELKLLGFDEVYFVKEGPLADAASRPVIGESGSWFRGDGWDRRTRDSLAAARRR